MSVPLPKIREVILSFDAQDTQVSEIGFLFSGIVSTWRLNVGYRPDIVL